MVDNREDEQQEEGIPGQTAQAQDAQQQDNAPKDAPRDEADSAPKDDDTRERSEGAQTRDAEAPQASVNADIPETSEQQQDAPAPKAEEPQPDAPQAATDADAPAQQTVREAEAQELAQLQVDTIAELEQAQQVPLPDYSQEQGQDVSANFEGIPADDLNAALAGLEGAKGGLEVGNAGAENAATVTPDAREQSAEQEIAA
jgi:hypothetical protein